MYFAKVYMHTCSSNYLLTSASLILQYHACFIVCSSSTFLLVYHAQVSVRTVDGVQGLEFRTLIISTVRTCSLLGDNEEDAGFLSNPKVW